MEEFYFDSNDKKSKLHAVKWIPECEKPVSILQIVHGMAEYIDRYDGFATFLAERGILVVGDDHLGHGKSLGENGTKGYFCEGPADKILVEDEQTLKKIMQQEYPDVPYFIFGHSMGSFITRNYLAQYGNEVQGAVICGTGMQAKGLLQFSLGLTKVLKLFQGDKHPSNLLNVAAFGSYCKKIDNAKTVFDWLSHDDAVVNAYIADPDCGFTFTINGFRTMFQLIFNLHDRSYISGMPKELPLLLIAGHEDPVGDYGNAVEGVFKSYKELGMQHVDCKLYDNMRHEILNELGKETVYQDVYSWIKLQIND